MKNTIIEARDVCFKYEGASTLAVDHVTLDVAEGEFLAILGRNGSGKSTFAKLLNALQLRGTWAERDGAFDLSADVSVRGASAPASFRLGGTAAYWQLTSPLLGDTALMFNNPAMVEFGNKMHNHLGLPLQRLALLYPYVWADALAAPVAAFEETFLAEEGSRIIPIEDCMAFVTSLGDMAETDRGFSNLLLALGLEEGQPGAMAMDLILQLPDLMQRFAPYGIAVDVTGDTEIWHANRSRKVFCVRMPGQINIVAAGLPEPWISVQCSLRTDESGVRANLNLSGGLLLRAEAWATEGREAGFTVSGSMLDDIRLPAFTQEDGGVRIRTARTGGETFGLTLTRDGDRLSLTDRNGCEVAGITLRLTPREPERWPDWTPDTVRGVNLYSLDDSTLPPLLHSIALPMITGLVPLVAAAPTSAVTAFMDWVDDSGLLTGR